MFWITCATTEEDHWLSAKDDGDIHAREGEPESAQVQHAEEQEKETSHFAKEEAERESHIASPTRSPISRSQIVR